jgi:predicted unusual protein kinase regulating ubiquinone biosynthesis (AarF/ABC1/UbiB family)
VLSAGCEAIGIDCSSFVFYHADLRPTNMIVEDQPNSGKIGIIDFEISGYFPRDWIRTKFRLSSGMNLSASASNILTGGG